LPNGHFLVLADLDEALFAVEGVLDFAAALSPTTLHITLHTEADGVDAAARQALHPLLKSVALTLTVQVQREPLGRAGKRQFTAL
jgi:hypothetical protein